MPDPDAHSSPAPRRRQRSRGGRATHRQRHHREAHANARRAGPPPVLEHPLVPANDPPVITRDAELAELITALRAAGRFAYDSEFIGEQSYHPRLCVIQVATPRQVTLIDALAPVDLTPFWRLLADASVEAVVHSGLQDLEPVVRHLDQPPRRIFDTQIAAAFVGQPYPASLTRLAEALLGADLGHGLDFSQWDRRPLSQVQLQYAANDVRYLPLLHDALTKELSRLGNTRWAQQACAELSDEALYRFDPATQRLRVRGLERLTPRQRAVLRSLVAWRDTAAREQDVPPRTLLKDRILVDLAVSPVASVDELKEVRDLPRPVERTYGPAILEAIRAGQQAPAPPPSPLPRHRAELEAHRDQIEALWTRVQEHCAAHHIAPGIVSNKKQIAQLVLAKHRGTPIDTPLHHGWRRELLEPVLGEWW